MFHGKDGSTETEFLLFSLTSPKELTQLLDHDDAGDFESACDDVG
jgi:hypothetical protein